jgi:prepilin-type processing-associated H-X9-DG protein
MGGSNVGFADGHASWSAADAFNAQRTYCGPVPPDGCCVTPNPGAKIEGICGKF